MARSSTTRIGNGAGYGGPAKGEGKPPGNDLAGRPLGVKTGEGKAARARELAEEAAPLAIQKVIDIMNDAEDQRSLSAAFGILNRVGMHEKSGVEHSGPGGGPVQLTWGDGST
jgi:hypothetical protein